MSKLSKPSRGPFWGRILSMVAVVAAFSVVQPTRAGILPLIGPTLTLTELSPTQLTAAYDGIGGNGSFMVTNTGPDAWTVTNLNTANIFFNDFSLHWTEPEQPLAVNEVSHSTDIDSNKLFVISDLGGTFAAVPNNTKIDGVGTEVGGMFGALPISLVFNDLAQVPETPTNGVPETGSALALFALALIGLLGIKPLRFSAFA